ncbi:MAG: flagellar biosynthesis anti-sigma factor FlgM [Terriglobales bacterium]
MSIELDRTIAVEESGPQNPGMHTVAAAPAEGRITDGSEFSPVHAQALLLAAQIKQLPEIRQDRVAAIANAIRNGTYQVSPEQTADAILSEQDAQSGSAA